MESSKTKTYAEGFHDGEKSAQRKYMAEIDSLRSQVNKLEQKTQWQPMDTAPQTGEWVYTLMELERSSANIVRYKSMAYYSGRGEWVSDSAGNPIAWLPSPPIKENMP